MHGQTGEINEQPPAVLPPVEWIPTDNPKAPPEPGIALCLSGGGYRAMLFHLGALWRLNEVGYLPKLERVSSVSGGSITAGMLGLAWSKLAFDAHGVSRHVEPEVVQPIRRLAAHTIDVFAVLRGIFGRGTISEQVAQAYREHLFGKHTLPDLPDDAAGPRFVINAANLQSGALWRFSRPYLADWRVGMIPHPRIDLAVAVAASSAFPPILSPTILHFEEAAYTPNSGTDLQRPPYTTRVMLTDGGVYDNLGLETAWKRYRTILVSDGDTRMAPEPRPGWDWIRQSLRVIGMIDNQTRSLRTRQLIASYRLPENALGHRFGAYWSIQSNIANYPASGTLPCPYEATMRLAAVPTRLAHLDDRTQMRLINWGYAIGDAAMRAHVDHTLPAPADFPYPDVGVG